MAAGETYDGGPMWSTPETKRTRIPFWKALGTAQQLRESQKVWVLFTDVIARIRLSGAWSVDRCALRPLQQLATSEDPGLEFHVLCRDGVVCLRRTSDDCAVIFDEEEMIVGEFVQPPHDPDDLYGYSDIVRVKR